MRSYKHASLTWKRHLLTPLQREKQRRELAKTLVMEDKSRRNCAASFGAAVDAFPARLAERASRESTLARFAAITHTEFMTCSLNRRRSRLARGVPALELNNYTQSRNYCTLSQGSSQSLPA